MARKQNDYFDFSKVIDKKALKKALDDKSTRDELAKILAKVK